MMAAARSLILTADWLAVTGICVCILFGYRRWAVRYFILPALIVPTLEYVAWPLVAALWPPTWSTVANWWWLILLVFIVMPVIAAATGISLFGSILSFLFGYRAAQGFTAEFLIRWLLGPRRSRPMPRWEHDEE
ncbi:MAG TPA: hypothetical protein VMF32_13140 [Xanthobacteraceae bacterium]|nr:hypothetical protein [Xanthobacteraceae bacterium]